LSEFAEEAGLADLPCEVLAEDGSVEGALDRVHRPVVFEGLQRPRAEVPVDLLQLHVQLRVVVQLLGVRPLLLAHLEVLAEIGNHVRFVCIYLYY
jgi:hypothetical protein